MGIKTRGLAKYISQRMMWRSLCFDGPKREFLFDGGLHIAFVSGEINEFSQNHTGDTHSS